MQWFNDLSMRYKILLIPTVGIMGFVIFLALTINANSQNASRLAEIRDVYFPVLEMAKTNSTTLERINELLTNAASTGEMELLETARERAREIRTNLQRQEQLQPQRSGEISQLEQALSSFSNSAFALTESMIDGTVDFSTIAAKASEKNDHYETLKAGLQQFRERSHASFIETVEAAQTSASNTITQGLVIGSVTVVVLLVIAIGVAYLVTSRLGAVAASLRDIAKGEGDLTRRLPNTGDDELGQLVHWFNEFVHKLQGTLSQVIEVINPLSDVAQQLNSVSSDTERVSSEQKRSADQVSEAMREMLSSVENIAANASHAAESASDADTEAKQGRSIVNNTVASINDLASEVTRAAEVISKLKTDTENVGTILDVIKGIAEQTNLLALNAAIEAARAGEQGRGFAVVADEVRHLASRTQESTQEIQRVIEELQTAAQSAVEVMTHSKERAQDSVEQASTTDRSLEAITSKVTSITDMNQQIAAATEEQQRVTSSIQESVNAMREASERAVSSTENVSSLSSSLRQFSEQLQTVSHGFKV